MDIGKIFGLDRLDKIVGRIEQRPINASMDVCLRVRDKTIDCEACYQVCPVEAISLGDGVEIDFEVCNECGICATVCPASVFASRQADDYYLAGIKANLETSEVIGFSCPKQSGAGASDAGIPIVELPCVGRINETLMVGAAVFGAKDVWLNISGCVDCENDSVLKPIHNLVRGVDGLLEVWGSPVAFSLTEEPPKKSGSGGETVEQTQEYDRRELFSKFGRELVASGLGLAKDRIDKLANVFDPGDEKYFEYHLPRRRELLLRLVKKLDAPGEARVSGEGLPIHSLVIDSELCNFCGNCSLFCPTRAIQTHGGPGNASITFSVSRCLGCDLCLKACSPRALAIEETIALSGLYEESEVPLTRMGYYLCSKCQHKFASSVEKDVCDFCEMRESKLQDDSWS